MADAPQNRGPTVSSMLRAKTNMDYLRGLNAAQLQAVKHPPSVPLQILAGPGSGKTKVLTTRIAHLIMAHSISPDSICAVTFTNKAANEMKERLHKLVGENITCRIKLGTFHALCASFLRKYPTLAGVGANFTVCDADESKKIIAKLFKPFTKYMSGRDVELKESSIASRISKAKSKALKSGDLWEPFATVLSKVTEENLQPLDGLPKPSDLISAVVAFIYKKYQEQLKESNSLDFDDLLVYGVVLFRDHPKVAKWCRHMLVDEFQDTNTLQYQLVLHIARSHKCVSIVGDPDQSIYGWRSAEAENLARMQKDFASTQQIYLEQNYRSTASILSVSLAIISQDKKRIPKTLLTSHPKGPPPVLHPFPNAETEATAIASEIHRTIAHTGGMLSYSDFAVLLRMNAMSRAVESALQLEGIPHVILGGRRFFDRAEVKDLIAYLQIVDNPQFVPAFMRIINVPRRTIGDKTVNEITLKANNSRLTPLEVVEGIHDGKIPDTKPPIKRKVASFVTAIQELREMTRARASAGTLVRRLLDLIGYKEHLKKQNDDWETRWENVQELVNFATKFADNSINGNPVQTAATEDDWMDSVDEEDASEDDTPLRAFLQASMLATDSGAESDKSSRKDKVTVATCHAAKGLEWPVVFVVAVEHRVFPVERAEDPDEERRLLYVACTRAQGLLYLSYCDSRMFNGSLKQTGVSSFISDLADAELDLFACDRVALTDEERGVLAAVLGRPVPQPQEIQRNIDEHRVKTQFRPLTNSFSLPAVLERDQSNPLMPTVSHTQKDLPAPDQPFVGFASARMSMPLAYPAPASVLPGMPVERTHAGVNIPMAPLLGFTKASSSSKTLNARQRSQTNADASTNTKPPSKGVLSPRARRTNSPTRRSTIEDEGDIWILDDDARVPEVSVDDQGGYRPTKLKGASGQTSFERTRSAHAASAPSGQPRKLPKPAAASIQPPKPASSSVSSLKHAMSPASLAKPALSSTSVRKSTPSSFLPQPLPKPTPPLVSHPKPASSSLLRPSAAPSSTLPKPAGNISSSGTQNNPLNVNLAPGKTGVKRRLGMTGPFVGYSNKKFKPPTL